MSKFAHGMIYAFSFVIALFISGMDLSEASPVSFKIVGGSDSVQGQWPWQALILIEKSHTEGFYLCGGSLIHASWVLTATYCVRDYTGVQILFGVWNISNSYENHTIRSVEQVIEHPCYDPESVLLGTNLALLKLTHPEPATNAICLPSSPIYDWEQLKQGQDIADCIATGYGRTDTGSGAKILQQVQFPFVSREICKQTYPGLISNDKICAYGVPGRHGRSIGVPFS
ncbi:chymotrypsin-like protease CTRL-1 isoform X2 [Clavelina lepadiformis]|uniref:chymotrypsin-like protease CTRL-1 isoform X2 n=1 Tax=Clavelina lepadiformis TaxID=159417 RepID=UPI004042FD28